MASATQRPRYQFIGYLGGRRTADFAQISDAAEMFDAFVAETKAAKFVHISDGCCSIWDRRENMTIANWSQPRPKLRATNPFDIFARLIARGEPISIVGPDGAAHFIAVRGQERVS